MLYIQFILCRLTCVMVFAEGVGMGTMFDYRWGRSVNPRTSVIVNHHYLVIPPAPSFVRIQFSLLQSPLREIDDEVYELCSSKLGCVGFCALLSLWIWNFVDIGPPATTLWSCSRCNKNATGVSSSSASYSTTRTTLLKLSSTKKDQSFPTWSFDKPCTRMEWNDMVTATIRVTSDVASYQDSDLILVGIYAPSTPEATTTSEGEEEPDDEAKDPPPVVLTGVAKEIDDGRERPVERSQFWPQVLRRTSRPANQSWLHECQ